MTSFFDINTIFFEWLGYRMSYLEFFGTLAGGVAVWLSAKANVWSWPLGLVNVVLFFFLFYQIQLYPDMFLQVFFFVTNLMGWWRWTHPQAHEANAQSQLKISRLPLPALAAWLLGGAIATLLFGTFAARLHHIFPLLFSQPSAFPYLDSFTTMMSVVATFWMIRKNVECWYLWLLIDVISTYMYFVKGVKLVGLEYAVFCVIALFGALHWTREYRSYATTTG
jgi:nicotinamide mononucleotide transporter